MLIPKGLEVGEESHSRIGPGDRRVLWADTPRKMQGLELGGKAEEGIPSHAWSGAA